MAIAEAFQSSASISTTEYFLAAASTTQGSGQSGDAAVQLFLDLANLVNGDEFRVRAWDAISSGGTARVIMEWTVAHAQSEPIWGDADAAAHAPLGLQHHPLGWF